jgi:hypothetical protein
VPTACVPRGRGMVPGGYEGPGELPREFVFKIPPAALYSFLAAQDKAFRGYELHAWSFAQRWE